MAKYVIFHYNNKPSTFVEVNDFEVQTVKALPNYKEEWANMQFFEGTRKHYEEDDNNVFSGELVKSVYYGKRLNYEMVKQFVGNDLKYKDLVWKMNSHCRNSFERENPSIQNSEDYNNKLNTYSKKFDREHFLLFIPPNNFRGGIFDNGVSVSVEEYDASVKLKYDESLMALRLNSAAGEEYLKKHQFLLEFFKNYFDMMNRTISSLTEEKQRGLFESCCFHFEDFVVFSSLEDVNFFLDICDYTYSFSVHMKELFKNYRKYVNDYYQDYDFDEGISLS